MQQSARECLAVLSSPPAWGTASPGAGMEPPSPSIPAWLLTQRADLSLKITYFYCSSGWEEEKAEACRGRPSQDVHSGDREITQGTFKNFFVVVKLR